MRRSTRRELIAAASVAATTAAVPPAWGRILSRRPAVGPGKFRDGVATGEPAPNAMTFWSRLTTDRPRSGARLIVATDEGLDNVVATTVVPTGRGINGTLTARVGGLEPRTQYFYAWESGNDVSPVGRTRTRPDPASAEPVRIAFSSCQNYAVGHYGAHAHAASEELDVYVFLGDYIYERPRRDVPGDVRPDPVNALDLRSYRSKYRLYRSDLALRELHRLHPAVHIWDDHEVANNYSDNQPPPSALQRSAAYRAAAEWIPRLVVPRDRHRIYRRIPFGTTAEIFLLDARQYRSGQNDGGPKKMLGDEQMHWLISGLRNSAARWKIIAQQVVVSANPYGSGPGFDSWDGFPEDRALMLGEIERAGLRDVVFLTGDAHVFMCNLLASDFRTLGDGSTRTPAAVEYVGGSVTSSGADQPESVVQDDAPWNKQYNGLEHGYAIMALNPAELVTEYRRTDISVPNGATSTLERFLQPAGANNIRRESFSGRSGGG